jgi:hypothetical protein
MTTQAIELKTAQTNYFKALLIEQKLKAEVTELNAPLHAAVEQNKITDEEWAEKVTHNEFVTGYNAAQNERMEAENQLIRKARMVLFNVATPEQWAEMQIVFDCKKLSTREKVVALCLQLKA